MLLSRAASWPLRARVALLFKWGENQCALYFPPNVLQAYKGAHDPTFSKFTIHTDPTFHLVCPPNSPPLDLTWLCLKWIVVVAFDSFVPYVPYDYRSGCEKLQHLRHRDVLGLGKYFVL